MRGGSWDLSSTGVGTVILFDSRSYFFTAGFLQWLVRSEPEQMRLIKRPLVLVSVAAWGQDGENKTQMLVPWNPTLPNDPLVRQINDKINNKMRDDYFKLRVN